MILAVTGAEGSQRLGPLSMVFHKRRHAPHLEPGQSGPVGILIMIDDQADLWVRQDVPDAAKLARVAEVLEPGAWDVVVTDVRGREAPGPDGGPPVTVHDSVLRAVRRPAAGSR